MKDSIRRGKGWLKRKSDKKMCDATGLAARRIAIPSVNVLCIQFHEDFDDAFYRERAKEYDDCTLEERVYRAMVEPELAPYLKKGE